MVRARFGSPRAAVSGLCGGVAAAWPHGHAQLMPANCLAARHSRRSRAPPAGQESRSPRPCLPRLRRPGAPRRSSCRQRARGCGPVHRAQRRRWSRLRRSCRVRLTGTMNTGDCTRQRRGAEGEHGNMPYSSQQLPLVVVAALPHCCTLGGVATWQQGAQHEHGMCALQADPVHPRLYARYHARRRARHGVPPLVWDDSAAVAARSWASGCPMGHSGVDGLGENMAWWVV